MRDLSEEQARVLEFEQRAPRGRGAKEKLIRDELGLTPVRYHQVLNQLVDNPAAMAEYPVLVSRLRRVRDRLR